MGEHDNREDVGNNGYLTRDQQTEMFDSFNETARFTPKAAEILMAATFYMEVSSNFFKKGFEQRTKEDMDSLLIQMQEIVDMLNGL